MKNILLLLSFVVFVFKSNAQNTMLHQTIASFKVAYKSVPQTTPAVSIDMQGIAQATLNLKPNTNVSKVYFKILDKTTNAVLYQVNYTTSSTTVTNAEGKKLFENNNGVIFISNGQPLTVKPYVYQVQTEDDQSKLSPIYSVIQ